MNKDIKKKTNNQLGRLSFLMVLLLDMALFVSVFFLMNYVQFLLNSDVRINLSEIVTQNKDVITSKLRLELNNLDNISAQIADQLDKYGEGDPTNLKTVFLQYLEGKDLGVLSCAGRDGMAYYSSIEAIDISGRSYFRNSLLGRQNISERMISRLNGDDIFILSVPLYFHDEIIGTIQKQYTPQEMYEICSVSMFSEQGFIYIINSEGYILISSQEEKYNESANLYRMLYLNNSKEVDSLERDIKKEQSGFMEVNINDQRVFSAYTPIDEVYDWYLISSVKTSAVSPNGTIVIRIFYFILFVTALFFALLLMYLIYRKNKERSNLERIAFVDSVTGGNTFAKLQMNFQNTLDNHLEKDLYLITFDIDNFKYINNYYGFEVGDAILKGIYNHYQNLLEGHEEIARITSDHYVMVLENCTEQRLIELFDSELTIDSIRVYVSAGVYDVRDFSESVNFMVDKANMAKQLIKGVRYRPYEKYSKEIDEQIIHNEQVKRGIEKALSEDEIVPYFQPKIDIRNRKIKGAEALARWLTKDGKCIPPSEFIPICEKTGLIVRIDMMIFDKTLKFLSDSIKQGIECVPISVNFSKMHNFGPEFLTMITNKIDSYHVPPELIEVELTETVFFDNLQIMENLIQGLHEKGIQISMDDFGTGYSSLHMLKDINIDVLKIDRGFLLDSLHSDKQRVIFTSIVKMAKKMNLHVVVEGVENEENIELMKESGCNIAQGFYYARPMTLHDYKEILKEGKL